MEGNLPFLFYFVFDGNYQVQAPWRAHIWRGDLTEDFLLYEFGGLISGGAYTWRGLFSEFYGILNLYIINSLGYLFVMFTTIIAFDVMSLRERTLREVVSPGRTLR